MRKQLWIACNQLIVSIISKAQILFGNVSQQSTTIILLIGLLIKCIAIDITSFPVIKILKRTMLCEIIVPIVKFLINSFPSFQVLRFRTGQ